MNQEVGSIMKFMYDAFPVQVYEKEVPINFETPSLYFPVPFSFDENDTNQTFAKTYNLSVKLFHHDSQLANDEAERIVDEIRSRRSVIPLLNEDGTETGDYIRFSRIETRIGDKGVANIILNWTSRYYFEKPKWTPAEYFNFRNGVKQ